MLFKSTRSTEKASASAAEVIKQGLATDGGLFVPETIPTLTEEEILALCKESYPVRAARILSKFLSDYTYEELLADCEKAYDETSFVGGAAPLVPIHGPFSALELWHGPTAAFKDMALQILPYLLTTSAKKIRKRLCTMDSITQAIRHIVMKEVFSAMLAETTMLLNRRATE